MQKIILTSLFAIMMGGNFAYAEIPSDNNSAVDENKPNMQQEELVKIMEENISFEKEKRQLINEVALEKLRSELKKLRGTAVTPVMPAMTETTVNRKEVSKPYVILVSKIGGLTRVLVSADGNKYYLSEGERFSSAGKNYVLMKNSTGKYQVNEQQK